MKKVRVGQRLGILSLGSIEHNPHLHLEIYTDKVKTAIAEIYELKVPFR